MKLSKVRVRTYRSIVDTGDVDTEEGVTVVIGKNEQGKTNFLKAIRSFNWEQQYAPSDLPNHLRPGLEDRPAAEIPIVSLTFALEPADRKKLTGVVHGIELITALRSTKYYDNHYQFWTIKADGAAEPLKFSRPDLSVPLSRIKQTADELKRKLDAHAERVPPFAANRDKIEQIMSALTSSDLGNASQVDNLIKTFTTSLKALTGQDQPIIDDITSATGELEAATASIQSAYQQDATRSLRQSLPTFVLHSTKADHIPNEVNVAEFVSNPDGVSRGCRTCVEPPVCHYKRCRS